MSTLNALKKNQRSFPPIAIILSALLMCVFLIIIKIERVDKLDLIGDNMKKDVRATNPLFTWHTCAYAYVITYLSDEKYR